MISCPLCGGVNSKPQGEVGVNVNWDNDNPAKEVKGGKYICRDCGKAWIHLYDGRKWTYDYGEVR